MKKALLFLSLLFANCASAKPEPINPLTAVDNQLTEPGDCVFSKEVDPDGLYYFVSGYEADGIMATSSASCDAAFAHWIRMGFKPVKLLKA